MKIDVRNLKKSYGTKDALNGLSFTLDGHKIYGLLGRNGAGKTTFMEILSGHILETSGQILVDGEQPFDNQKLTESICLIKEGNNFKKELKIKQVLRLYSYFYPTWDMELAHELVKRFNLNLNDKVKALSKGMKSALGIIVGLASNAKITIFDEPYIGLDAASRQMFYDILLDQYQQNKRMIIFSTHLIDEVAMLFEEVLILEEGSLVLQEQTDVLRSQTFAVTGKTNEVTEAIENLEVIGEKTFAGMTTAYVYAERETLEATGLQVEGVPVQELMIYLTRGEEVYGAAN